MIQKRISSTETVEFWRETDRLIDRHTDRQKQRETDRHTDRHTDRQKQRERERDRQTDRQRETERERQTNKEHAPKMIGGFLFSRNGPGVYILGNDQQQCGEENDDSHDDYDDSRC